MNENEKIVNSNLILAALGWDVLSINRSLILACGNLIYAAFVEIILTRMSKSSVSDGWVDMTYSQAAQAVGVSVSDIRTAERHLATTTIERNKSGERVYTGLGVLETSEVERYINNQLKKIKCWRINTEKMAELLIERANITIGPANDDDLPPVDLSWLPADLVDYARECVRLMRDKHLLPRENTQKKWIETLMEWQRIGIKVEEIGQALEWLKNNPTPDGGRWQISGPWSLSVTMARLRAQPTAKITGPKFFSL